MHAFSIRLQVNCENFTKCKCEFKYMKRTLSLSWQSRESRMSLNHFWCWYYQQRDFQFNYWLEASSAFFLRNPLLPFHFSSYPVWKPRVSQRFKAMYFTHWKNKEIQSLGRVNFRYVCLCVDTLLCECKQITNKYLWRNFDSLIQLLH